MKEYRLKQCALERKENDSVIKTVSYIPERYAKIDKILRLKDEKGWTNGWKVIYVSEESISSNQIVKVETAHKKQRKFSDI